jgi:hypothetical protein
MKTKGKLLNDVEQEAVETLFIGQNRGWDSPWVRGNLEKGLLSRLGITITPRWQKGYFRFCCRKART